MKLGKLPRDSNLTLLMPAFRHPFLLRLLCCLAMVQQLAVAQDPVAPPATQAPTEPPKPPKEAKHARRKPNRLAAETSPYLLQHAHNPVDWRPWGPEALAHAKKQNKPILLSIGYSSCHWCHVMERESFVDEEIAKVMNANFVCIKIDREERPDIDKIYMTSLQVFLQLTNGAGNGGWPLTMFLTPDAKPFYGGSYFPARDGDRPGMPGFLTIVQGIAKVWKESPERVQQDADVLTRFTKRQLESTRFDADFEPDESFIASVQADLAKSYDEAHGGFGFEPNNDRRPKFPEPANLLFLIQRVRMLPETSEAKAQASSMLHGTLEKMAMGGIRDHVGGGFHRYSVDRRWDIPHFEKMLYDNGLLATVYAEAYALQPKSTYRRVLLQMTEFLQREMTADGGAFYAALDADSEGEEGSFYVWTRKEIQAILDDDEYQLAAPALGLNGPPNFEGPHYALRQSLPPARLAALAGLDEDTWATRLDAVHRKLLAHRSDRERPGTDFKILTAWNGLMIRGLADSGRILKEPSHIKMAERAATFLLDNLRTDDGQLRRSYAKGQAKLDAYLDDYAYLVHGLIGLHQATGDRRWLDAAQQLTDLQIRLFWDDEAKGFFYTATDHESLLARSRNLVDGARPSGNSVSANNLLYLAQHAEQPRYRQLALETMKSAAGIVERSPAAAPNMGAAAIRWRHQP